MFHDLFTSLATPCSPPFRALGYLNEALDMRRRARRNHAAWQPHLDRTRRFVLSAAEQCSNKQHIVVLGSGLLLDVPLAELSALFGQVTLKDVVCFPEIKKQISRHHNVSFVEHDVTGLAEHLFQERQHAIHCLPEGAHPELADDRGAGLVVSLNLLSQLWVVPRAFIGQRLGHLEPEQVDDWCARIVEDHYAGLRSLSSDVCLVADYESVKRDRTGNVISRGSTIYGLDLPKPDDSWTWNIAPLGAENPHTGKELIVGAWYVRQ